MYQQRQQAKICLLMPDRTDFSCAADATKNCHKDNSSICAASQEGVCRFSFLLFLPGKTVGNYLWERSDGCWDSALECPGQRAHTEWWHSNLPCRGFLLKLWRMNPILEPLQAGILLHWLPRYILPAARALVLQIWLPDAGPEERTLQLQHLQFNPRERPRFEDKSKPHAPVTVLERGQVKVSKGETLPCYWSIWVGTLLAQALHTQPV